MNVTTTALTELFDRIPRRHSAENVKDIYNIVDEYEAVLLTIEAENVFYEKNIAAFFDTLQSVRSLIKKSTDNKASKKNKDLFFDDASVVLKDSMLAVIDFYAEGGRTI
jgi:hypothetical protein